VRHASWVALAINMFAVWSGALDVRFFVNVQTNNGLV
jgi:hypothetical protein